MADAIDKVDTIDKGIVCCLDKDGNQFYAHVVLHQTRKQDGTYVRTYTVNDKKSDVEFRDVRHG